MKNFITNHNTANLKKRLIELIRKSDELKFLVGFFYFSGIRELYEGLKEKPDVKLKILVGLQVDKTNNGIFEFAGQDLQLSDEERCHKFLESVKNLSIQRILIQKNFTNRCGILLSLSVKTNSPFERRTIQIMPRFICSN